ncbi:hypothetical protein L579_3502 [Pantoea sp. AS-PWVM4]|uniref:C1 family peptidase n=1 Tax=Pantoea sp. AS-PWVM4 TaxID=1332069 RepID=UPI0003AC6E36|nr:C1 family peptidase [Pantoea sp. AS-PWVM4]ERK17621.1 hypothetical protein L579_3502 [Pantoea sp. AS-PWVM4]
MVTHTVVPDKSGLTDTDVPQDVNKSALHSLDARADRFDFRDLPFRPQLKSLNTIFPDDAIIKERLPAYVKQGLILNQGREGACTGFGLACVANYLLWTRHQENGESEQFEKVSPRMFYEMAKRYDEWPGTEYQGSSCRGALKGWQKHGVCSEQCWPFTLDQEGNAVFQRPAEDWADNAARRPLGIYYRVDRQTIADMQAAISEIGAIYVSCKVHDGWENLNSLKKRKISAPQSHAEIPVIGQAKKPIFSGHSFAMVGYNDSGFVVQNSWGEKWGAGGFAILTYDDWIVNGTDCWACALGVPIKVRLNGILQTVKPSPFRLSSRSLTELDRATRQPGNPPNDPWPIPF